MSEKPGLEKPVTNLQALIWSVMMEAKYGKKDWLELLDETIDTLHDAYILYDYADVCDPLLGCKPPNKPKPNPRLWR